MSMLPLFILYILVCLKTGLGLSWYDYVFMGFLCLLEGIKIRLANKSMDNLLKMEESVYDLAQLKSKPPTYEDTDKKVDPFDSIT